MFKNAMIYRIQSGWVRPDQQLLEETLKTLAFTPCEASQEYSGGWTEPRGVEHGPLVEHVGGQMILAFKQQSKAVPGSAVKDELAARVAKIEEQTGRKAGKKEKRDLSEEIKREMLPHAFRKTSTTPVWVDPDNMTLVVGSSSSGSCDKIVTALVQAFAGDGEQFAICQLNTEMSPGSAMSVWLGTKESPYNFSVDRECELKASDESKAVVKYSRHTLDIDEIAEHIKTGKVATKLAMTWAEKVSFVLTETMTIKKIAFLDTSMDNSASNTAADGFDADVALATGELKLLIPDLLLALGGERSAAPAQDAKQEAVKAVEHQDEAFAA
jgi:recombination associated protein RdgC